MCILYFISTSVSYWHNTQTTVNIQIPAIIINCNKNVTLLSVLHNCFVIQLKINVHILTHTQTHTRPLKYNNIRIYKI